MSVWIRWACWRPGCRGTRSMTRLRPREKARSEGRQASAARDGVFRDGAGAFRRGGLRGIWDGLSETLADWGCWDPAQGTVTTGGLTQARQRLGDEPVEEVFAQVAVPVATEDTEGAFLGQWRKMSMDGLEWDVPAAEVNMAAFGFPGTGRTLPRRRFPGQGGDGRRVRVARGGAGGDRPVRVRGQRRAVPGRTLYPRLREDWLLMADGSSMTDRTGAPRRTPGRRCCGGSEQTCGWTRWSLPGRLYRLMHGEPGGQGQGTGQILEAARGEEELDPERARYVRVVEYEFPDARATGKTRSSP